MTFLRGIIYKFLVPVLLFPAICYAQFPEFRFQHINEEQNLSHSSVLDIIQDKEGFLWFGTIDGLNRFDGYTCKVFKHDESDSTSLSSNFIHGLFIDTENNLWITTRDGGLNRFNKYKEEFIHYSHNPADPKSISNDKVATIIQDKKGNYWVTTDKGLDKFDPVTGKFQHIKLESSTEDFSDIKSLDKMTVDKDGIIWINSLYGLIRFNPVKMEFKRYRIGHDKTKSLNDDFIHSVYKENNILWITTNSGGLTKLNLTNHKTDIFYPVSDKGEDRDATVFGKIFSYSKNLFFIASENRGLFFFDKEKKIFTSQKHNPENSFSISNNHVSKIYKDKQNNIWIGTWGGGINKIVTSKSKFRKYQNNPFDKNSISGSSVFAILKDKTNNVWIGTSSGVLDKLNTKDGRIIHYNFNENNSIDLRNTFIDAIFQDQFGFIWFAADGLARFDPVNNKIISYKYDPSDPETINSNTVRCISEDRNGNLWVGFENGEGGAAKYNFKTNKWIRYLTNKQNPLLVRCIYQDRAGMMWFATSNSGLISLDLKTGTKIIYKNNPDDSTSISYNDVRQVFETRNGELWMATYGGGINKLNRESGKFISVKENDGLSNNFTYAILEDKDQNFWISTNLGITKYNRKNNTYKYYTVEDGLQNNEFNTGAYFKADDGEMFFGGVNGFNRFYPDKVTGNSNIPPVYLTSFKLLDKEIKTDTSIIFKRNITLSYFDKIFSVEFAALDYTDPAKNQYKYKLEGFDNEWIKADHRRYASYTNLDPGHYTLKILGSNNDGVWNTKGVLLNITVTPPFWLKWWFITTIVLVLLIILVVIVRYYSTKKLKEQIHVLEKEKAVQTERERISRDLHDNVGSQLTNIITGIGLAEIYSKSEKQKADDLLNSLKGELRETMTQLRETIWALKSNEMSCDNFASELRKLVDKHSKYYSGLIHLNVEISETTELLLKPIQALYIFRIVQEAITNSVKHSGSENISITITFQTDTLSISIKDDGSGFKNKTLSMVNGNGIENMKKRAEEIGGVFEIKSGVERGVDIFVSIPI